jgi:phosphopantothenoylcysteine decarboxylase / phosphopantothenate---cysteine ligase
VTERRLAGRRILLGVTGSIAAYKAVVLARLFVKESADVRVVMTRSATEFVGASTFAGITGKPALTGMFDADIGGERHVELAREADLIVVVPITADLLARIAAGRADDLLTATALCARCPLLVAPAMHPSMWSHPATRRNVATLRADGRVTFAGPVEGEVASGDSGEGRMAEPEQILELAVAALSSGDLAGRRITVTAGPTVEDIDPVRFLGNRSSGKMGFALAERASLRGATVTLVAGPVSLPTPSRVSRIDVRSAHEMQQVLSDVATAEAGCDALLMAAAVGDYRPLQTWHKKMKRLDRAELTVPLVENPDILAEIGHARRGQLPVLVGFAVETGKDNEIIAYARRKLREKKVDFVVANHAHESMGRDDNRVLIVDAAEVEALDVMPKPDVADRILDRLRSRLDAIVDPSGSSTEAPRTRGKKSAARRRKRRA